VVIDDDLPTGRLADRLFHLPSRCVPPRSVATMVSAVFNCSAVSGCHTSNSPGRRRKDVSVGAVEQLIMRARFPRPRRARTNATAVPMPSASE
jgi:hypothetical protein